ncbi:capsular synthesis two-component sensor kinase and response regulator transcription protein [Pandoraea sputorum]|uniref:histidine kinase n=2 Tax=Pandoraea sputorum TaxID=93222 RepID=A0A5E5BJU9_9BURK|nr:capsular synthesis two-component sensor kinase and response regulator transcription protein [Pandoraea sputorum]
MTAALSMATFMLVCAAGVIYMLVMHQRQDYIQDFVAHREALKAEVDRQEASVRQLVSTYELAHWGFGSNISGAQGPPRWLEVPPWPPSENAPTIAPYSILSTLNATNDQHELEDLLGLTSVVSTSRVLRDAAKSDALRGFVYSPDGRFLGSSPPLTSTPFENGPLQGASIVDYLRVRSAPVEHMLRALTDDKLINRVFWLTVAKDPLSHQPTTYLAAPVFERGRRLATIVLTMSSEKFSQNFLRGEADPSFFVVTWRNNQLLGIESSDPYQANWIRIFERHPEMYVAPGNKIQTFWRDGSFLITQRVPGPDWIAVYAYTWKDMLLALRTELLLVLLATILCLCIVSIGAVWLRNSVVRPSGERVKLLAESEAFSRAVLHVAPVSLAVVDRSTGAVLMRNTEAQELSVLAAAQLGNGLAPVDFLRRVGAHVHTHAHDAMTAADIGRFEMAPELDVAYASAQYKGQEVFVIGLVNLAQRKEIERTLLESRRKAEEANHDKGLFVATISHEIRTPLHGALGNLELLSMSVLGREQRAYLEVAMNSFKSLLSLINDVLDFSKLSDAKFALCNVDARIDEPLELTVRTLYPIARSKGVRLICLIAPEARGLWHLDPARIFQVMMNLVGNAVKFTDHGTVTAALSVDQCDRLLLRVADTGRGISEGEIERIFMPFVQGDAGVRHGAGGTGLGLALCKKIVAHMGGEISVQSECGVGTLFSVSLPASKVSSDENPRISPAPTHISISCEHPLWAASMREQFGAWFPLATIRVEESAARSGHSALSAHDEGSLQVIASTSVKDVPHGALDATRCLLIALDAPFTPTWCGSLLQVSAYSGQAWLDGVAEILSGNDQTSTSSVPHGPEPWRGGDLAALVVEDDGVSANLLRDQLRIVGISRVDIAASAEQAMSMNSCRSYDLVISDSNLPGMGGMTLYKRLRALGVTIPIFLCSADVTVVSQAKAIVDGILIKPVSILELRNMLREWFPEIPSTPHADAVPEAARCSKRLADVFLKQWIQDRASMNMAIELEDISRTAGLLHRVRGGLLILDEMTVVSCLDALSASIDQFGTEFDRLTYVRFMRHMDHLVERLR